MTNSGRFSQSRVTFSRVASSEVESISWDYAGAGNLGVGQWWPLQMCAKRNRAHGEIEAAVHVQAQKLSRSHLTTLLQRMGRRATVALSNGRQTRWATWRDRGRNPRASLEAESVFYNHLGAGNLVMGQWWPLQMCDKREGALGEIETGTHVQAQKPGRSSVITSVMEMWWWSNGGSSRRAPNATGRGEIEAGIHGQWVSHPYGIACNGHWQYTGRSCRSTFLRLPFSRLYQRYATLLGQKTRLTCNGGHCRCAWSAMMLVKKEMERTFEYISTTGLQGSPRRLGKSHFNRCPLADSSTATWRVMSLTCAIPFTPYKVWLPSPVNTPMSLALLRPVNLESRNDSKGTTRGPPGPKKEFAGLPENAPGGACKGLKAELYLWKLRVWCISGELGLGTQQTECDRIRMYRSRQREASSTANSSTTIDNKRASTPIQCQESAGPTTMKRRNMSTEDVNAQLQGPKEDPFGWRHFQRSLRVCRPCIYPFDGCSPILLWKFPPIRSMSACLHCFDVQLGINLCRSRHRGVFAEKCLQITQHRAWLFGQGLRWPHSYRQEFPFLIVLLAFRRRISSIHHGPFH